MKKIPLEISRTLELFERHFGFSIVVYDFTGRLASHLPSNRATHQNPFCRAMMQRDGAKRCAKFDCSISVPAFLKKRRSGFYKRCHGNVLEYVQGLWSDDLLLGALLFGPFQWPEQLDVPDTILTSDFQSRLEKANIALHRNLPVISRNLLKEMPLLSEMIADRIIKIIPTSSPIHRPDRQRRWIVEDFIARRFPFPETSLMDLAHVLRLSEHRARHVVAELFGHSFMDLLTSRRLLHARNLLTSTNLTVTQLIDHCGYTDSHHFHRMFRKAVGMTPLAYRSRTQRT